MTILEPQELTEKVNLPGGQTRLRRLILYIAERCRDCPRFGFIKLNKILWRSDFASYAARIRPVTGRPYQRLPFGPAPKEMLPILRELEENRYIDIKHEDFGDGIVEKRVIPLVQYDITMFDKDDIMFVEEAIKYYWDKTGAETSDDSHWVAWRTRYNRDPMPYELSFLSDNDLSKDQLERISSFARTSNWQSY